MKQRIFSRGKGWYIPCKNYKDDNDKATLFVNFKRGEEPPYNPPQGQEWCFLDIDIEDAKFGCSKGNANMMVWSYTIIQSENKMVEVQKEDGKMFGASNFIEPEDLPFY